MNTKLAVVIGSSVFRVLGVLLLILSLHSGQSLWAISCAQQMSEIYSAITAGSSEPVERSEISLQYWAKNGTRVADNKREDDERTIFSELVKSTSAQFENGLPTYEPRPLEGFTRWVIAFGREYPLNPQFIAAAEEKMKAINAEFTSLNTEFDAIDRSQPDSKQRVSTLLNQINVKAAEHQYYSEMLQSLRGEVLPYHVQGMEFATQFVASQGTNLTLREAHIRLWQAETKMMEAAAEIQGRSAYRLSAHLALSESSAEADFYRKIIPEIEKRLQAQNRRFGISR